MNSLSLAYSNAQKQHQESSWIDDPFELKGFITGVVPVSHERNLNDYALELVADHAEFIGNQYELNLDKLSEPYQFELIRHYIESIDRNIEWACYGEDQSINSDFLCALLSMLKEPNSKTRENFAQVTLRNLLAYYHDVLQNLLDESCHVYYCNEMNESGYHSYTEQEHGDVVWKR